MSNRRDEIDFELRQFRRLERKVADDPKKIRDDIEVLIARREAEKAALLPTRTKAARMIWTASR